MKIARGEMIKSSIHVKQKEFDNNTEVDFGERHGNSFKCLSHRKCFFMYV